MRKLLILGVAALALSACSNKDADADGDGKVSEKEASTEMASGGALATKPGMWEIKTVFASVEAPSVPPAMLAQMKAQAAKGVTVQSCLTKEQVENPGGDFFGGSSEANCTIENLDRSGERMTVAMTCKPAGGMVLKSKMDGSFAAETYSMNVEQSMTGMPGGDVKMTGKAEGKRIGDCPA